MEEQKPFTLRELKELVGEHKALKAWKGLDQLRQGPALKPAQIEVARKLVHGQSAGSRSSAALPCFTKFFAGQARVRTQFLNWLDEEERKLPQVPADQSRAS